MKYSADTTKEQKIIRFFRSDRVGACLALEKSASAFRGCALALPRGSCFVYRETLEGAEAVRKHGFPFAHPPKL